MGSIKNLRVQEVNTDNVVMRYDLPDEGLDEYTTIVFALLQDGEVISSRVLKVDNK